MEKPLEDYHNKDFIEKTPSASKLLDRETPGEYKEEWTRLLMKEKEQEELEQLVSVVIFRLSNEWLGLVTTRFKEVSEIKAIHTIPHRRGELLLGMVNIRGQLRLCFSMHNLLEIQEEACEEDNKQGCYPRMIVIEDDNDRWVFPVQEVFGIDHFRASELQNVPVTVTKSVANYLKGMFPWEGKSVGLLDDQRFLEALQRSVL